MARSVWRAEPLVFRAGGMPGPRLALLLVLLAAAGGARANYPLFDVSTRMRVLLVPADARVGSAVYRLRATDSDFQFPLHFDVVAGADSHVVRIEALPCSRNSSHCEADVLLASPLERGRDYEVKVTVRDTSGDATTVNCTVRATNATTPMDTIFPHRPALITVSEFANRGTALDYIVVRNHPKNNRFAFLELRGSPLFDLKRVLSSQNTVNNTIVLVGQLDFEQQVVHYLTVYATDAYAEPDSDTRNLLSFQVAVVVRDEQDTPPVFTRAPPVTRLNASLQPGDVVVRVEAQDGDRGAPREVRFGMVSESQPLAPLFQVDERTGEVSLARRMEELLAVTRPGAPLLLTIMAEEVRPSLEEAPAASAEVTVALVLDARANQPPYFASSDYDVHIAENSPMGTALNFQPPYETVIHDDDIGKQGLFSIELTDNNGTFEVSPAVGEGRTSFIISVRDSSLLDYEQRQVITFEVVARELSAPGGGAGGGAGGAEAREGALWSAARVTVHLDDVNDNAPAFARAHYEAEVREDATAGTALAQVNATDADTGRFGRVRYTRVLGEGNETLLIDHVTGVVSIRTNSHCFDRETAKEFSFYVEARDMDGEGLSSLVPLVVTVLDVNDHTPLFERTTYDFYLANDRSRFLLPAFVHAIDTDAEYPNNAVWYTINNVGLYVGIFSIERDTGELTVDASALNRTVNRTDFNIQMTVTAYDGGDPPERTFTVVNVSPAAVPPRTMRFILPGPQTDLQRTAEILSRVTGGRVVVRKVGPYKDGSTEVEAAAALREAPAPAAGAGPGPGPGPGSPRVAASAAHDAAPEHRAGRRLPEHLQDARQPPAAHPSPAPSHGPRAPPGGPGGHAAGQQRGAAAQKTMVEADVYFDENGVVDLSGTLQTSANGTVIIKEVQKPESYTRSDSYVVFWILIVLAIIIVIAIIVLILCCLCAGCPLYVSPS